MKKGCKEARRLKKTSLSFAKQMTMKSTNSYHTSFHNLGHINQLTITSALSIIKLILTVNWFILLLISQKSFLLVALC